MKLLNWSLNYYNSKVAYYIHGQYDLNLMNIDDGWSESNRQKANVDAGIKLNQTRLTRWFDETEFIPAIN